ncbi:MAG: MurR/RpiR family transcriptional regulator [Rhodobacterales bacterium]|nr:MurR/RpiR family transcriptional regulator [Rhodobacterales bacterium]
MNPQATRTLADEIRRNLDRLTPTERRPAQVLLTHYPLAGLGTVSEFAARAGVSPPTILRLVAKLGCSGYADFQRRLRQELEARLQTPLTKHEGPEPPVAEAVALPAFVRTVQANIEQTLLGLPDTELAAAVALLADIRRPVHLLGGRFTHPLAAYLCRHLRILRPRVSLVDGRPASWPETLLDMGKRDVLVVFDIRRYQDDVVAFAEAAARRGAAVVLFTDPWLSPVARVARHVFPAHIDVGGSWDSSVGILVLVEALIHGLNERDWTRVKARIGALEALRAGPDRPEG